MKFTNTILIKKTTEDLCYVAVYVKMYNLLPEIAEGAYGTDRKLRFSELRFSESERLLRTRYSEMSRWLWPVGCCPGTSEDNSRAGWAGLSSKERMASPSIHLCCVPGKMLFEARPEWQGALQKVENWWQLKEGLPRLMLCYGSRSLEMVKIRVYFRNVSNQLNMSVVC